jgi:type III secretion protein J
VRLAYAISQELADTFSRIDGVLTARVHVVPTGVVQAGEQPNPPSAAVFMRHLPDSPVTNLVARVREVTAKAVPNLSPDRVSVMLVPTRESVSVPMVPQERFLGISYKPADGPPFVQALTLLVAALCVSGGILLAGYEFYRRKRRRKNPEGTLSE